MVYFIQPGEDGRVIDIRLNSYIRTSAVQPIRRVPTHALKNLYILKIDLKGVSTIGVFGNDKRTFFH